MATFQEIFNQAQSEINTEPGDLANIVQALKDYYDAFHPFFTIGNAYLRGGLPFFTQGIYTLAQMRNQMHNQIENKQTCRFVIKFANDDILKVCFLVRPSLHNAIRVQLIHGTSNRSEEHINQEAAAAVLAKIVLRYKD